MLSGSDESGRAHSGQRGDGRSSNPLAPGLGSGEPSPAALPGPRARPLRSAAEASAFPGRVRTGSLCSGLIFFQCGFLPAVTGRSRV